MIKFDKVEKYFGKFHALKDINLKIDKGETVVLIGPSGSGKSTLLRCINGLERITEGTLKIDGVDLYGKDTKLNEIRSNIGMVFQHFELYPHKTVLENITLAPIKVLKKSKKEAEQEALDLLEQVGLQDKKNSHPSQLSGGQKQRVAIARALAMKPRIMLFDEPTSALDPEMVGEVLDVMKLIAKRSDVTMIVVTHEMGFAREMADRLIFMADGEILEDRESESFFENPHDERAITFLSKIINH